MPKIENSAIFNENFEIRDRCKGVHCVDLGESFPTSIYLQNLASIQPRTSPVKFACSPRTDPPACWCTHSRSTRTTRRLRQSTRTVQSKPLVHSEQSALRVGELRAAQVVTFGGLATRHHLLNELNLQGSRKPFAAIPRRSTKIISRCTRSVLRCSLLYEHVLDGRRFK